MTSWHFAQPLALLLLLVLPILVWHLWRQRRGALRFPIVDRTLPRGRGRRIRWSGILFRILGLICLIAALAGPRWPDEGSRIPTQGRSIAIVLDVSGSMAQEDFEWQGKKTTRLDATKKVFHLFVNGGTSPNGARFPGRKHDLTMLVVFATIPEVACPLTLNHRIMTEMLAQQQPRALNPKTNIGDALILALNGLNEAGKGRRVIVLLSDGEHNVAEAVVKPRQAAQLAGNYDVPIYVIDAGKDDDRAAEKDKTDRQIAKKILQEIAQISNGKYFAAQDTAKLLEVSRAIDQLETEQIETFRYRRYHDGFVWFALIAFVFLASVHCLEWTLWRRIP